jgi:hypothetical protein
MQRARILGFLNLERHHQLQKDLGAIETRVKRTQDTRVTYTQETKVTR